MNCGHCGRWVSVVGGKIARHLNDDGNTCWASGNDAQDERAR